MCATRHGTPHRPLCNETLELGDDARELPLCALARTGLMGHPRGVRRSCGQSSLVLCPARLETGALRAQALQLLLLARTIRRRSLRCRLSRCCTRRKLLQAALLRTDTLRHRSECPLGAPHTSFDGVRALFEPSDIVACRLCAGAKLTQPRVCSLLLSRRALRVRLEVGELLPSLRELGACGGELHLRVPIRFRERGGLGGERGAPLLLALLLARRALRTAAQRCT